MEHLHFWSGPIIWITCNLSQTWRKTLPETLFAWKLQMSWTELMAYEHYSFPHSVRKLMVWQVKQSQHRLQEDRRPLLYSVSHRNTNTAQRRGRKPCNTQSGPHGDYCFSFVRKALAQAKMVKSFTAWKRLKQAKSLQSPMNRLAICNLAGFSEIQN